MNLLLDIVTRVLRMVIKLAFYMLAAVFLLVVLAIALSAAIFAMVLSLLTGRKPAFATQFTRFRQAAQPYGPAAWRNQTSDRQKGDADIVDVQAREVNVVLGPNSPSKPTE